MMLIYFSGGPFDGITRQLENRHPLVDSGAFIVIERLEFRPRGALDVRPETPRRGQYVRVGPVALWWGWDGTRPDIPEPFG